MKKLDEILDMCPNFYDRESFANGYIKGYEQSKKDLQLGWEDFKFIHKITYEESINVSLNKGGDISEQEFYQEVLKRFKDLKK